MRSWFAALLFLPGLAVAQPVDGFQTAVAVRAGSQTDPHISGTVIIWRDRFAIPGLDGQQAVLYRSKLNPLLGRNFEAMGPLEWLARMSDHIPDPGQHRTLFYGEYANRVRGERHPPEDEEERGRRGASWVSAYALTNDYAAEAAHLVRPARHWFQQVSHCALACAQLGTSWPSAGPGGLEHRPTSAPARRQDRRSRDSHCHRSLARQVIRDRGPEGRSRRPEPGPTSRGGAAVSGSGQGHHREDGAQSHPRGDRAGTRPRESWSVWSRRPARGLRTFNEPRTAPSGSSACQ